MMEAFFALPGDKQERIINAALMVFALHGYRKASVADIAKAAGISKAMVFTYFGTKAGLYCFLCEFTLKTSLEEYDAIKEQIFKVNDYFDRLVLSTELKMRILKRYSTMLDFTAQMFFEQEPEVRPTIDAVLAKVAELRNEQLSSDVALYKFKEPKDTQKILKLTEWIVIGMTETWKNNQIRDIDEMISIFREYLLAIKKQYYKEEYLNESH